ncbi:transcriptional regulator [Vibrio harveyi]|nr:transcriptional regulator [Vibrio harveyi]
MESGSMTVLIGSRFVYSFLDGTIVDTEREEETKVLGKNSNQLLSMMIEHPNQTLSRQTLFDSIWTDNDVKVTEASLTQAIATLRRTLCDNRQKSEYILTVPKCGYRFIASVECLPPDKLIVEESLKQQTQIEMPSLHREETTYVVEFYQKTKSWLSKVRDAFAIW